MEQQVIFRPYQEQTEQDHNNLQDYARASLDHLVYDAITTARRWAGFSVTKSGQVELTVTPGRITDNSGAIFALRSVSVNSLATRTAASAMRVVSLSAYPYEDPTGTDEEQRDFLVDVANDITEPRSVSMTRSRDAILVFTNGEDSASPVAPPLPANHVEIARILMDTTQIVRVDMVADNQLASNEAINLVLRVLSAFKTQIEPRVNTLASDLAGLQLKLNEVGVSRETVALLRSEIARINRTLKIDSNALDAWFSPFLIGGGVDSDYQNTLGLGYNARVHEGIRFPHVNQTDFQVNVFAANDPNAQITNNVLLPKFVEELKLYTGDFTSELGMAQFGFQTVSMKQGYMSRSRLRYGGGLEQCSNGAWFNTDGQPSNAQNLYDFNTTGFTAVSRITYNAHNNGDGVQSSRIDTYWFDQWLEPYMYAVTQDSVINGAQVAQSFLVSNDMWATSLEFYLTAVAAVEDVNVVICQLTNGVPDLTRTFSKTKVAGAALKVGWNKVALTPSFFRKGDRYAVVLVSNANHKIGMTAGQNYLDGTFFYSTDQVYYQGDLTKDLMLRVNGARFLSPQVSIELLPLNLDGGIRLIDIQANMIVPDSCDLIFEIRANGAGSWLPLTADLATALDAAPTFVQMRARFVGTSGVAPALTLTGDGRIRVSRPALSFKHVSTRKTLNTPSKTVVVTTVIEGYNPVNSQHTFQEQLFNGGAYKSPNSQTMTLLDATAKRYSVKSTYVFPANISDFIVVDSGTTTTSLATWHVALQSIVTL